MRKRCYIFTHWVIPRSKHPHKKSDNENRIYKVENRHHVFVRLWLREISFLQNGKCTALAGGETSAAEESASKILHKPPVCYLWQLVKTRLGATQNLTKQGYYTRSPSIGTERWSFLLFAESFHLFALTPTELWPKLSHHQINKN